MGRIVRFVLGDGQIRPAVIMDVDEYGHAVDLHVYIKSVDRTAGFSKHQVAEKHARYLRAIDRIKVLDTDVIMDLGRVCSVVGEACGVIYHPFNGNEGDVLIPGTWHWPPKPKSNTELMSAHAPSSR